jgi:hypothetical protein
MEQINPTYTESSLKKTSFLTHVMIFLYAIAGSALLTVIGKMVFEPRIEAVHFVTNFWAPLLFGILAVFPLIFFSGRRAFAMKKKILLFIVGCTFSQWLAFIAAMLYLMFFVAGSFLLEIIVEIPNYITLMIALTSVLVVPSIVAAGAILSFQRIFFNEFFSSDREIKFALFYALVFPIILAFFVGTESLLHVFNSSREYIFTTPTYLKISFFWQLGILYFVTWNFSRPISEKVLPVE